MKWAKHVLLYLGVCFILSSATAEAGQVSLAWTAPSENSTGGTVLGYDLRYSSTPVSSDTLGWWGNASQAAGEPSPASPGATESQVVGGLTPSVSYTFLIRSFDEAGNVSPFSNVLVSTITDTSDTTSTPDTTAVVISGITVEGLGSMSARISWQTNIDTYGFLRYGPTASYGSASSIEGPSSVHSILITGLSSGQTYHYQSVSYVDSRRDSSLDGTFTTLTDEDGPPAPPQGVTASNGPGFVGIGWNGPAESDIANFNAYWTEWPRDSSTVLAGENFEGVAVGGDPPEWRTSQFFSVVDLPGHGKVWQGDPVGGAYQAHYRPVEEQIQDMGDLEFTGNLMLTPSAIAGLVVRREHGPKYYQFEFSGSDPLHIVGFGVPVTTVYTEDFTPLYNVWYSYRVRSWTEGSEVLLACSMWPEGESEPPGWQIIARGSGSSPSLTGTVGIFIFGWSETYFDDFEVRKLPPSSSRVDRALFSSWIHQGLSSNSTYHYWVEAVDQAGNRSKLSNVASGNPQFLDESDQTPPAAITDLAAIPGGALGAAQLTWTATGDDGGTGTATSYSVKYSSSPIDEQGWNGATTVNSGVPKPAGQSESLTVVGLSAGETYYFAVRALDEAGNESPVSNSPGTTLLADTESPVLSGIGASSIQQTSALIHWTTDEPTTASVNYGLTPEYELGTVVRTSLATVHSLSLSNLQPETVYHYKITSSDGAGNSTSSADHSFITASETDSSVLSISSVTVQSVSDTDAVIVFSTSVTADGFVDYGLGTTYPNTVEGDDPVINHVIRLSPLVPGELYHFQARATLPGGGEETVSGDHILIAKSGAGADTTAPVIIDVALGTPTSTRIFISWTTDENALGKIEYGLSSSYGLSASPGNEYSKDHSGLLEGLTPGTSFHFRIVATDFHENIALSGDFEFATEDDTTIVDLVGPIVSSLAVINIGETTASVSWSTNEPADGQIEYGLELPYTSATPLRDSLVTSHTIPLAGLSAGNLYHFRILTRDDAGNLTRTSDFQFTTAAEVDTTVQDTIPPVVSGIVLSDASSSGVTVSWNTDEESINQIEYGVTDSYGSLTSPENEYTTSHTVRLQGLTAEQLFHFRVRSWDETGNSSVTGDHTFMLSASDDLFPPEILEVTIIDVTGRSARISWRTNEPAEGQIEYGKNVAYDLATPVNSNLVTDHEVLLENLDISTEYHFRVLSRDQAGNLTYSDDLILTTAGVVDSVGPEITGIELIEVDDGVVQMLWTTSEPSRGHVEYGLDASLSLASAEPPQFLTSHFFQVDGLATGRQFFFQAVSRDQEGNRVESDLFSVWIGEAPDSSGPVFSGEVVVVPGIHDVEITWTTDEPSDSRVEYGELDILDQSSLLDLTRVTLHRVTLTNLIGETEYSYRLLSRDQSGNLSLLEGLSFTTIPDTASKAPSLESTEAVEIHDNRAVLRWETDIPSIGQIEYGQDSSYSLVTPVSRAYSVEHTDSLTGLEPGTLYYYRIRGTGESGRFFVTSSDTFRTPLDLIPPPHATSFAGLEVNSGVQLGWQAGGEELPDRIRLSRRFVQSEGCTISDPSRFEWESIWESEGTALGYIDQIGEEAGPDLRCVSEVRYVVHTSDSHDNESTSDTITVSLKLHAVPIVTTVVVQSNRPNPFNPYTAIPFRLPDGQGVFQVRVTVFDITGREIKVILNEPFAAGLSGEAVWNGLDTRGFAVGSGVYFYRFESGEFSQVGQMILIR